jgi:hypothetical protein
MSLVIDTNVAVVASRRSEGVSEQCVGSCIDALLACREGVVLVDDRYLIFDEYRRQLSHSGQPGMGDAFFKWLWSNQANSAHCRKIAVTPTGHATRLFEEFPDDPALLGFDRDDQKFVAVALGSGESPWILNAVDTDWANYAQPLWAHGIRVRELCAN